MQDEIKELKLPASARDHALHNARRAVGLIPEPAGEETLTAIEEAFADFTLPRRTDDAHAPATTETVSWDSQRAAQVISAQLQQLDAQRQKLAALLDTLE